VLGELNRTLDDFYRAKAAACGIENGRSGSVTVIQRVGSAINLNPPFHNLSLDGVFTQKLGEPPEFHPVGLMTDEDVAEVTALVRDKVLRLLRSEGVLEGDDASFSFDDLSDDSPSLAGIYSASVQGRVAMDERAGRRVFRIGTEDDTPWLSSSALGVLERIAVLTHDGSIESSCSSPARAAFPEHHTASMLAEHHGLPLTSTLTRTADCRFSSVL